MSEASSLHYVHVHNTLSLPEDKEQVSALQLAMLIFACCCDRVCRVLVGFCSQP